MTTPLAPPPKKADIRFDDWITRLWKRLTSTTSGELGLGTMADQNADAVAITGGTVNADLTGSTNLPIASGISGLGTGIATALSVNTGSAGAPVLFNGALGTPSSGTVTNLTGTASININGTVGATTPTTGAFTTLTTSGNVGIRVSSPLTTLHAYKVISSTIGGAASSTLALASSAVTGNHSTVSFGYHISGHWTPAYFGYICTDGSGETKGDFVFGTRSVVTDTQPTERMRIDSSGNVLVTSSGGLGYGTGSGGTVTQATSRTTGVTLNKPTGSITLVSAAGSATWQSFTLTNSTIAATDMVCVCQKSGTDLYQIHVTAVAAGSCRITFATTGGTTTEQPVFNFAVLKGATS